MGAGSSIMVSRRDILLLKQEADDERKKSAEEINEQGKRLFDQNQLQHAVELFTLALSVCPSSYRFHSNRSAAYYKLGMFREAAVDARQCILLKPQWAKGYFRFGKALMALNQIDNAEIVLIEAWHIWPYNREITSLLTSLEEVRQVFDFPLNCEELEEGDRFCTSSRPLLRGELVICIAPVAPVLRDQYLESYCSFCFNRVAELPDDGRVQCSRCTLRFCASCWSDSRNPHSEECEQMRLALQLRNVPSYRSLIQSMRGPISAAWRSDSDVSSTMLQHLNVHTNLAATARQSEPLDPPRSQQSSTGVDGDVGSGQPTTLDTANDGQGGGGGGGRLIDNHMEGNIEGSDLQQLNEDGNGDDDGASAAYYGQLSDDIEGLEEDWLRDSLAAISGPNPSPDKAEIKNRLNIVNPVNIVTATDGQPLESARGKGKGTSKLDENAKWDEIGTENGNGEGSNLKPAKSESLSRVSVDRGEPKSVDPLSSARSTASSSVGADQLLSPHDQSDGIISTQHVRFLVRLLHYLHRMRTSFMTRDPPFPQVQFASIADGPDDLRVFVSPSSLSRCANSAFSIRQHARLLSIYANALFPKDAPQRCPYEECEEYLWCHQVHGLPIFDEHLQKPIGGALYPSACPFFNASFIEKRANCKILQGEYACLLLETLRDVSVDEQFLCFPPAVESSLR